MGQRHECEMTSDKVRVFLGEHDGKPVWKFGLYPRDCDKYGHAVWTRLPLQIPIRFCPWCGKRLEGADDIWCGEKLEGAGDGEE